MPLSPARIGAQELFDCRTHKAGVGREPAAVLRMLRQMPQARADCAPRRGDTGDRKKS
jgi:hypothetical protein